MEEENVNVKNVAEAIFISVDPHARQTALSFL